ncbi:site-specific DNA-methyltransferase [uncultured Enterovirga sp.]|uniref:site-specific DNA-methyltransferase n=1 Tax=uncultured Enterovirga sp. TaxID=2026352 RepID=UPI0035CA2F0E
MKAGLTYSTDLAKRNDLCPELRLVTRSISDLTVPRRKVRKQPQSQIEQVAAAIQTAGNCDPVLIDQDNNLIDGEVRLLAHKLLGLDTVPCIVVSHLDARAQRYLRLSLNRLQEKGSWDLDGLKLEFQELLLDDIDLRVTGFDLDEIDQILLDEEPSAVERLPPVPKQSDVRPGDLYGLGESRVVCGNALDPDVLSRLMGGKLARLILTDQPFNVPIQGHVTGGRHEEFAMASGEMSTEEFLDFTKAWVGTSLRHLVDGGVFGTFIDWRGQDVVTQAAAANELSQLNLIVWAKTNAGMGSLYRSQHELLPLFKKGNAPHVNNIHLGRKGRSRSNLWTYPGASAINSDARRGLEDHPTVKPVALLEDAILDMSDRGETVLDPFLGSGSTLIAAEKTGRTCYGLEIEPHYVQCIINRFESMTGQAAVLLSRFDAECGAAWPEPPIVGETKPPVPSPS